MRDLIEALVMISIWIAAVFLITVFGLFFGDMISRTVVLFGVRSSAADWIAHLAGIITSMVIAASIVDRIGNNKWWWA